MPSDHFKAKPELEEFRKKAIAVIAENGGMMSNADLAKAMGETTAKTQGAMKSAITTKQVELASTSGRVVYKLVSADEF